MLFRSNACRVLQFTLDELSIAAIGEEKNYPKRRSELNPDLRLRVACTDIVAGLGSSRVLFIGVLSIGFSFVEGLVFFQCW